MKNKLIIFTIISFLFLSYNNIYAIDDAIDVNTLIQKALDSSSTLKQNEYELKKLKITYNNALYSIPSANEVLSKNERLEYLMQKGDNRTEEEELEYHLLLNTLNSVLSDDSKYQLEKQRDITEDSSYYPILVNTINKTVIENTIKLNVMQLYCNVLKLSDSLKLQTQLVNNLENTKNDVMKKFSLGLVSNSEVQTCNYQYKTALIQLRKLERSLNSAKMALNNIIGESLNKSYSSYKDIEMPSQFEIKSLDYYISSALKNRAEIIIAEKNLDIKKQDYQIAKKYIKQKANMNLISSSYNFDVAQNNLDTLKINIQLEIINNYKTVTKMLQQLETSMETYNKYKRSYEQALTQYRLGLIQQSTLNNAQIQLMRQENEVNSLKRDIWLYIIKLDYSSQAGPSMSSN